MPGAISLLLKNINENINMTQHGNMKNDMQA
jgi:hypothetical protein